MNFYNTIIIIITITIVIFGRSPPRVSSDGLKQRNNVFLNVHYKNELSVNMK